MTKTHRKSTDTFATESASPPESELTKVELPGRYDHPRFQYDGHRQDRLADATDYATLTRSEPWQEVPGALFMQSKTVAAPNAADRELMASLAIDFEAGAYRFENVHYRRLADAVSYAKSVAQRQEDAGGR